MMQPDSTSISKALAHVANKPFPVARSYAHKFLQDMVSMNRNGLIVQSDVSANWSWLEYEMERNPVEIINNVAVIRWIGAVYPYAEYAGGAVLDRLNAQLDAVAVMDAIDTIVIYMDSPGGDGTGVPEAAEKIAKLREKKKVVVYGYGMICSASYWIAAAADAIVAYDNAIIGSIGVVTYYMDFTGYLEMFGIKEYEVLYSRSPKKNATPVTDEGRAIVQQMIDDYGDLFVANVASYRNTDVETVLTDYGQGDVFIGTKARDRGMIDEVMSFEALLKQLNTTKVFSLTA